MADYHTGTKEFALPEGLTDAERQERAGALLCEKCELLLVPEDAEHEAEKIVRFIGEHQHHGTVWICYQDSEGAWRPALSVTLPDA